MYLVKDIDTFVLQVQPSIVSRTAITRKHRWRSRRPIHSEKYDNILNSKSNYYYSFEPFMYDCLSARFLLTLYLEPAKETVFGLQISFFLVYSQFNSVS